jgi:hypothetical protein
MQITAGSESRDETLVTEGQTTAPVTFHPTGFIIRQVLTRNKAHHDALLVKLTVQIRIAGLAIETVWR